MVNVLQADFTDLHGLTMSIAGNVPTSGGLSSSASLEMAVGYALLRMNDKSVDGVKLALSGQKTENEFVGVQCGIMDQFISALGQKDYALLIDCQDLSYKSVPIPPNTAIIVVDSGVQRGLVDSEYNTRRQQCELAAAHFGLNSLRLLDIETFNNRKQELPTIIRQRATHVITENARTLALAKALTAGNMSQLGPLMAASHQSMRADFEITVPAIDTLVEIMQDVPGVYGARMTGGGFGGCCVALAPVEVAPQVTKAIENHYYPKTGYQATIYECHAAAGASEI
jgi:galactokinase